MACIYLLLCLLPSTWSRFLAVDEYVVHLYDKYGEGGLLNKKAFTQVGQ